MKTKLLIKIGACALIGFCAFQNAVLAQNKVVSGIVKDAETGEAMPFVNVALMRPADTVFMRGATTDMEGRFNITAVDTGSYLLQASFVGYHPWYAHVSMTADGELPQYAVAMRRGTTLQTVEVSAEKPLYLMDGEKNMYNTKEDPSIQTGTASDALQNAPGVEVDAEGNITLRGVSSVDIWINDRPSHMNEEALKQYIKTLPANAIERIEVITNPSARYSTKGGVINIVTNQRVTRNELLCVGLNSNISPESRPMVNNLTPWVSYVWANEKIDFNVYMSGSYTHHEARAINESTLRDSTGAVSRYQKYTTDNNMPYYGGYAGMNFNWNIDSMTQLSAWVGGYPIRDLNSHYSVLTDYVYNPFVDSSHYATTKNRGFTSGVYGGAWYEHRYDTTGRKLSVNLSGNYWSNSGTSDLTREYTALPIANLERHILGAYYSPSMSMGADYTLPLKNAWELEAGVEVGYSHNSNDDRCEENGSLVNLRSYHAMGTGWSPAAYVTAQKRWGGFTAKVGLRGEGTYEYGELSHYGDEKPLKLDTFFFGMVPSLHLSYQTKDFASYSLSYTRRFSQSEDMMDYTLFRLYDDYTYRTGNPDLQKSYTHNIEAAWNKYFMGFGMVSLNGYFRANENEQGTSYAFVNDPVFGPIYYTYPDNISTSHTEGIGANLSYRPTGFLNVRFNATLANYGYKYQGLDTNALSYSLRLNVWAKVWGWLEIYANGRYSSPTLSLYSVSNARSSVDMGVSGDFFNRQLSVHVSVNDIFGWAEFGSNTIAPQYQSTGSHKYNSRFISVGLTWRMGKMELESKARQGGTDSAPQMK